MTTIKTVGVALLLAAGGPPLGAAESSGKEDVVRADQVPAPARASLQQQAGKHRIHEFTRDTDANGAATYSVRYHTATSGDTEVEVAPNGDLLGIYRHLEEPEGSGP
jgi:hypothetical protein